MGAVGFDIKFCLTNNVSKPGAENGPWEDGRPHIDFIYITKRPHTKLIFLRDPGEMTQQVSYPEISLLFKS